MTQLFATHQILRVDAAFLADYGRVPVPNGSEATWATDLKTKRRWIRKREYHTGPEPLLAECVSFLLGSALGLRQPVGALATDGKEWSWLSEVIENVRDWRSELGDLIANPDEVASMLVLDAIIGNQDRHAGNILVKEEPDSTQLQLWSIDSGKALVGWPHDFQALGILPPEPGSNHAVGLPIAAMRERALEVAQIAVGIDPNALRNYVREACDVVAEPEFARIEETLIRRCSAAPKFVPAYLDALEAM